MEGVERAPEFVVGVDKAAPTEEQELDLARPGQVLGFYLWAVPLASLTPQGEVIWKLLELGGWQAIVRAPVSVSVPEPAPVLGFVLVPELALDLAFEPAAAQLGDAAELAAHHLEEVGRR